MSIYIAGHSGMVGSAILRCLQSLNYDNIITKTRQELDLTRQDQVEKFFEQYRPDYIIDSAARVGGILDNSSYPADFIRDNLLIQTNLIETARKFGCKRFCFLGSSCIYPKLCPQPIKEEYLLSGSLEKSNIGYAIAKIAGVQMIRSYREQYGFNGYSLMPTNMYGIFDRFDPNYSHALPSLIYKFHEAKISGKNYVLVWGNEKSKVRREWLFVDDAAEIIVKTLFLEEPPELMNIGVGYDISIHDLSLLIKKVVGYEGEIEYDSSKPEGTPQKLLDISKMKSFGLEAKTNLETGIRKTYEWFLKNKTN